MLKSVSPNVLFNVIICFIRVKLAGQLSNLFISLRIINTQGKMLKMFGARAILKFAGDLQIAEIVRWQFYL